MAPRNSRSSRFLHFKVFHIFHLPKNISTKFGGKLNDKKYNSALFTLFIAALFTAFSINTFAQKSDSAKTEQPKPTCSGKLVLPASVSINNEAFGDFIKVASLPAKERRAAFSKQTNEQKASFIKVNLALQFIKRANMTSDQKEFVLDAISKVSADIYDKTDIEKVRLTEQNSREIENKALGLFAYKELGDFIEPLMTNKDEEVALLQKYEDLLKNGMNARKKIAKEMPVNDRVNIWKTQLAYHLATGKFSKIQNEFILEALTSLSSATFASRANMTKEEEAKALETLESSMFKVFTIEEAFSIFMSIGIQKNVKDETVDSTNLLPDCNCRWYCGSGSCESRGCNQRLEGCGPFGDWVCYLGCV